MSQDTCQVNIGRGHYICGQPMPCAGHVVENSAVLPNSEATAFAANAIMAAKFNMPAWMKLEVGGWLEDAYKAGWVDRERHPEQPEDDGSLDAVCRHCGIARRTHNSTPGEPLHRFEIERRRTEQANSLPPFVRGILEVLADREWDPNDIVADGGVTALDVVRKDARTALGK